jgi:hypothetical protein
MVYAAEKGEKEMLNGIRLCVVLLLALGVGQRSIRPDHSFRPD